MAAGLPLLAFVRRLRFHPDAGFSLPDVCVAAGLLATALVSLAGLLGLSIDAQLRSRFRTYATVLAHQKVEQLRAEAVLNPSAAPQVGSDRVDMEGHVVGNAPPSGFVFIRRWRLEPLAADPARLLLIEVEAGRPAGARVRDGSQIVTVVRSASP